MSTRRKRKNPMSRSNRTRNRISRRRKHPKLLLSDAPPVNRLSELVEIGTSHRFYRNLDTVMLWKITPHLKELNDMVGMEKMKETVFFQVIYYLQGMHERGQNEEYLHTLITGPPGHGKTVSARIIGKLYKSMGILSGRGKFKIAHRDDFVAEYLGQTATKTRELLESCIGGVLFIDEVYSLAPGRSDRDSFAKEALDTLTAFLSEHKNDFCCIAAGYEDDVRNCFFAMNKGLERRFPWVHKIDQYKPHELAEIFMRMVTKINWKIQFNVHNVTDIIARNKDLFKNAGGDVETFISKCKMIHSRRVFSLSKEHKCVLTVEDLENTIDYIKQHTKPTSNRPPEHMYV